MVPVGRWSKGVKIPKLQLAVYKIELQLMPCRLLAGPLTTVYEQGFGAEAGFGMAASHIASTSRKMSG